MNSDEPLVSLQWVSVPALVFGNSFIVLGPNGKRLTRTHKLKDFEQTLFSSQSEDYAKAVRRLEDRLALRKAPKAWRSAFLRLAQQARAWPRYSTVDPLRAAWLRRCDNLSMSLRLRQRDFLNERRTKTRRNCQPFLTTTWEEALPRMWQQAWANYLYHCAPPWQRWTRTVAKNLNRRGEGRYATREA